MSAFALTVFCLIQAALLFAAWKAGHHWSSMRWCESIAEALNDLTPGSPAEPGAHWLSRKIREKAADHGMVDP